MDSFVQILDLSPLHDACQRASGNLGLRLEYILRNPERGWDWSTVSVRQDLSFQTVFDHPALSWDWTALSRRRDIDLAIVLSHLDLEWSWRALSINPSIPLAEIEAHPELPWVYSLMARRSDLTFDFFEKHFDGCWDEIHLLYKKFASEPRILNYLISSRCNHLDEASKDKRKNFSLFYMNVMSQPPVITLEKLEQDIDGNWDWDELSSEPFITLDFVLKHLDKDWYWRDLLLNPNISFEEIVENTSLPWYNDVWSFLSENEKLTPQIIERFLDEPWDWERLTGNPSIPWSFLEKHLDKFERFDYFLRFAPLSFLKKNFTAIPDDYFLWNMLSFNRLLPLSFIEKNLDKPWTREEGGYYCGLPSHPSLTPEFIQKVSGQNWWRWDNVLAESRDYDLKSSIRALDYFIYQRKVKAEKRRLTKNLRALESRLPSDLLTLIGEKYLWI